MVGAYLILGDKRLMAAKSSEGVLVVELSLGHYELFYSLKNILEPEHKVYFGIESLMLAEEQGIQKDQILFLNKGLVPNFWRIHRFCKKHGIKKIWLNTAAGPRIGNLVFFLRLFGYQIFGTLHNAHKLGKSNSQRFLSNRLSGYLVLSRLIKNFCLTQNVGRPVEFIYTCFFAGDFSGHGRPEISEHAGKLKIAVVGQIERKRRNLDSLIDAAKELKAAGETNLVFKMIGNSNTAEGKIYRQLIADAGVESYFHFFYQRLDFRHMLSEVQSCDAVALMFHPATSYSEYYKQSKISGAYNFALGLNRPLLVHDFLKGDEYENFSVLYNDTTFVSTLKSLIADRTQLARVQQQMKDDPRIQLSEQKKRVFQFLGI